MKQNLFNKLWLRVGMIVAIMTTALGGTAWADEVVAYTLTPASGSNNGYANNCDIEINGITWNLTGNSTIQPWRIGGKSLSDVNRTLYSKTAITDNVSKIEVTHGAASSVTVNSWTVIVASDASFNNVVSTLTPTFAANTTTTIERPVGKDWSNCYYKFVYNITISSTSNKYLEFTNAKFYKETGTVLTESDLSLSPTSLSFDLYNDNSAKTITCTTSSTGAITVSTSEYVTTSVSDKTITVTPVKVTTSEQTITVSQDADESYAAGSATFTVSITNSAPDYTTLPFEWAGGTPTNFAAQAGCSVSGADVYSNQETYQIKLDGTGDYIQVKTDSQPGKVTIGVKMVGGGNTSTITVQESADGETFTNVQALTISGAQNDELTLETTKDFAASTRYVRLYFTKGSNVGVGPISIALPSNDPVISAEDASIAYNTTIGSIEYEIVHPVEGGTISASTEAEWLTFGSTGTAFTATVNNAASARTADVTLTYTYNNSQTVTKDITLTQGGNPEAPGTENNPYTVAQARAAIDAGVGVEGVYATGIVSEIVEAYSSQYHNISYNISADGLTTSDQLEIYRGKSFDGDDFTSENDIQVGDVVVVFGNLTKYNSTYEFAQSSQLVSLVRPEKPKHTVSFSVNGTVTSTDEVSEQSTITFPANPADIGGKTFVGWTTAAIEGTTDTAPTFVTSATMGTADVTYYAVFATASSGGSSQESLEITATTEGVPSSYGTANTFTEYTLEGVKFQIQQMYKNGDKLQWRAAGNSNGTGTMYNSETLGKIESIILTYNEGDNNKNFTLHVGNSANPADGEEVTPSVDNAVYTFNCSTDNYGFFVLTNGSGAGYVDKIVINYSASSITYSGYCTTVAVPTSQTVIVSAAGYATIVAEEDLTIPSGVEVYAVQVNGASAHLEAITDGIPSGEAVLVRADADTYDFPYATEAVDEIDDNDLVAATTDVTANGTQYCLANKASGIGFYQVKSGVVIPAGKAYLVVEQPSGNGNSAKAFYGFDDEDDPTAIENVNVDLNLNGAIYNVAGQRLQKMQKGINIVNGKKILK